MKMATVAQREVLEGNRPLQAVAARGRLGGFGNLLRKELGQWWGTKMWWVQLIIWLALLNGISAIVIIDSGRSGEVTALEQLQQGIQVFLELGAMAISIAIMTTVQGAIVGEKQLGTAAWVLSKPASRPAFILAKLVGHVVGFGATAVVGPAIVFVVVARLLLSNQPVALLPFLAGLGLMALALLFYLTLTLMLGTVFESRGPITATGIGILLGGIFLSGMLPEAVVAATPWLLPKLSSAVAMGMPLPGNWYVPVLASGAWTVLFTIVALWRFNREEF
jgi:ABC-2 type transport system permease protein